MQNIVQAVYYSGERLLKKSHFHDCHQIILILKGNVEFSVNGITNRAGAGDIAIFNRYENHSVRIRSAEYERYVLHIDPDVVNGKSGVYSLLTDRPAGFCNIINIAPHVEDVVGIFKGLMCEKGGESVLADEMEQLLVKQLLIKIYRCTDLQFDSMRDDLVSDIKRQFENAYDEHYTLDGLARQYGVSVSALSHRFRTVTGMPVMGYLQFCRIAHAKRMLAYTDLCIGEIVEKCGFSDNSNFSRTFKNLNGTSPTDFRKQYRFKAE